MSKDSGIKLPAEKISIATPPSVPCVPPRIVLFCLCIHILFCWIYLNVEPFSDPTWLQNFVTEVAPGIFDFLMIGAVAVFMRKKHFTQLLGFTKPHGKNARDLIGMIVLAVILLPIIVLLPHWCPTLKGFYVYRPVFPDEAADFVRDCMKTGHTEYIGYFFIPKFIAAVILAPISEEILYRGMLFKTLLRRWSPIKSGLLSVSIFVAGHIGMVIANGLTSQFAAVLAMPLFIGVATCDVFYRTKCLWLAVVFHLLMNGVAFAFGLGKVFFC